MDICKIYSILATHFQNIKNLPITFGIKMLNHVIEEENDKKLWEMWLMKYQHMDKENFMPFSEFCNKSKIQKQLTKKTAEEILKEAYDISRSLGK